MAARISSPLAGLTSLLAVALLCALALAAPAGAATATSSAACANTQTIPAPGNLAKVERATLCLLNVERAKHGLRPLRRDARLARAARRHVKDMVRKRYFAHDSRSGASFSDRIRKAGYMSSARSWTVGENIAWGAGGSASAAVIVRAWMSSPGHRANILNGRFREIGIGLKLGSPNGGKGATYATEFGAVKR